VVGEAVQGAAKGGGSFFFGSHVDVEVSLAGQLGQAQGLLGNGRRIIFLNYQLFEEGPN
jgi:hypothetical protein